MARRVLDPPFAYDGGGVTAMSNALTQASPSQASASSQSTEPPLGVCHVVLSLDVGGLERIVIDLLREGRKLGQRVSVICLERRGDLVAAAEQAGAKVVCLDKPPGIQLGLKKKIAEALSEIRPDVIHTHQVAALFYAGPAARKAGVRAVIHTEHGKHYAARWRTRMLGKLAARRADTFCCVSADIATEVINCGVAAPKKVRVVPNGIPVADFAAAVAGRGSTRASLGFPSDAFVIGTVGRLSEIKRQDLLIRAFAKCRLAVPAARLLLVGDGPERANLESLARELGVADIVHFAGYQNQPQRYLAAMDLFALTSRSEGMPLVVLEAWAAGAPVVASKVGGIPELITSGATGMLFESGSEEELTAIFTQLATDTDLREQLRDVARNKVTADFDIAKTAAEYERQYRYAVASRVS
jgi:glycosyltransferase involved in cell wall biosynthesis